MKLLFHLHFYYFHILTKTWNPKTDTYHQMWKNKKHFHSCKNIIWFNLFIYECENTPKKLWIFYWVAYWEFVSLGVVQRGFQVCCTMCGVGKRQYTDIYQIKFWILIIIPKMCQCVCCDCWWMNCFGVCCGGLSDQLCCIGYWCCAPDTLPPENQKCCYCCEKIGCGGNCFCTGSVCCAPDWIKKWSDSLKKWNILLIVFAFH